MEETKFVEGDPIEIAEVSPPATETAKEQGLEDGDIVKNDGEGKDGLG